MKALWSVRPQSSKLDIHPNQRDGFSHIRCGERDFRHIYIAAEDKETREKIERIIIEALESHKEEIL